MKNLLKIRRKITGRINKIFNSFKQRILLRKFRKKEKFKNGKTIMFWHYGGMNDLMKVEIPFALLMQYRGYNLHFLVCDGVSKACISQSGPPMQPLENWAKRCPVCIKDHVSMLKEYNFKYSFLKDYLSTDKILECNEKALAVNITNIDKFYYDGVFIGDNIRSSLNRFFQDSDETHFPPEHVRLFANTAMINLSIAKGILDKVKPFLLFMSHPFYAEFGPAFKIAQSKKIPIFSYSSGHVSGFTYAKVLSNNMVSVLDISDKTWNQLSKIPLTSIEENRLKNFICDRYTKVMHGDIFGLFKKSGDHPSKIIERYNLDKTKKKFGIMSQITWDNSADNNALLYKTYAEWIYETISIIKTIPDVEWLVKIHPAEKNDNKETGIQALINKKFPHLPSHIKIIPMDADISPLDFYNLVDGAAGTCGTSGLEVVLQGKPVITAALGNYAQRGFTYDGLTKENYERLLKNAANLPKLTDKQLALAQRYAYIYFFRMPIPSESCRIFKPGQNRYMELICDRIEDGEDILLPGEWVK